MALICSILIHVAIFLFLDHIKIGLQRITDSAELVTAPVHLEPVELPVEHSIPAPPEDAPQPPPNDAAALLEEIDILKMLPEDEEIDIKPAVLSPEYALNLARPAEEGQPEAVAPDLSSPFEVDIDLPEPGRMEESLPPAAEGQVIVDPGAIQVDDSDLRKFTDDLMKKGAEGKARAGSLDGVESLDSLLGLPPNVLVGKKTMLPSDLLFEFNSDQLRESAKIGLMKLGLLIDRNPDMFCWIEGHTDLIGGEQSNLELSRRRAQAVKSYLVDSLRMDGAKIITRGFGKSQPIIPGGTADEQAPNRRVEIRMRKEPPPPETTPPPPRAEPVEEEPPPPRATEVPEEPDEPAPPAEPVIPRAEPVGPDELDEPEEPPAPVIPRAEPVDDLDF
ncbi:MAG: OmpA family protein [Akkermansiaceae bacterium]|nr:OmpA family protein [Akkermansiaceae bacterium]